MAEARDKMIRDRRGGPRVFYLSPADHAAFERTGPPKLEAMFSLPLGHKPRPMECLGFDGIAVRPRDAKPGRNGLIASVLFSHGGRSVQVPFD